MFPCFHPFLFFPEKGKREEKTVNIPNKTHQQCYQCQSECHLEAVILDQRINWATSC